MGKPDSITKLYMQNNERFADAFNFYLYGGEQVIDPEKLVPLDTASVVMPFGDDGGSELFQRFRDIMKAVTIMRDEHAAYLLLGIENQTQIHYAMVIRNLLYDAIQYALQVEKIAKANRKAMKARDKEHDLPETSAEFLSGFYRSDKLVPVITLTIYFGADEWDAPRSLHEMLAVEDKKLLGFIDDYHLHLISPFAVADNEFDKFHTELRSALKFIKYIKNKEKLKNMLNADDSFRSVSRQTAELINIVTGAGISCNTGEESVNMRTAIDDIREDAFEEGKSEGRAEGKAEGKAEGIVEGVFSTLGELVKKGLLTLSQAAEQSGMSVSEFERNLHLYENAAK